MSIISILLAFAGGILVTLVWVRFVNLEKNIARLEQRIAKLEEHLPKRNTHRNAETLENFLAHVIHVKRDLNEALEMNDTLYELLKNYRADPNYRSKGETDV